jgi:acetyltransferase
LTRRGLPRRAVLDIVARFPFHPIRPVTAPRLLEPLLHPRSIAVLGASADPDKLNGRTVRALLDKGYAGALYPVNPKYPRIGELPCYPDIASLPEPVDLAIVALPAAQVAGAVRELAARGVRALVVFSSGFSETGAEGLRLETELRAAVRETGLRMLGPNCLGYINAAENVMATFSQFSLGPTPPGPAAFVTQSGALGTATNSTARRRGLDFGYFINTGNEADVDWSEAMRAVLEDPAIRVGSGYIEGLRDGARFVDTAAYALEAGKPLVVIKVGRSGAGARAAASHTGALAGADAVFDGVARQYAVQRVRNEEQLLDLVEVFAHCPPARGNGVAIVTRSGGAGVIMADRCEELGLRVAQFSEATRARLAEVVPMHGAIGNPVDVTAQGLVDPTPIRRSLEIVMEDPAVDVCVIWLSLTEKLWPANVDIFRAIRAQYDKPLVVCWVSIPEPAAAALREAGIPVIRSAEPAIDAVAGLVHYSAARRRWLADAPARAAPRWPAVELPAGSGPLPTLAGAALLAACGVPHAAVRLARTPDEAVAAADELGWPVALKIESPDILHKTEARGVKLALADEATLREAWTVITANVRRHHPDARIDGMIVQEMAAGEVEFVLGIERDPVFGPVVMAGVGGVLVEVIRDVSFRRAPLTPAEADRMLGELRAAAMLDGVRGRPPVDRAALCALICALSRLAAAAGPRLREVDLNPLLVSESGAIAVDWLFVLD